MDNDESDSSDSSDSSESSESSDNDAFPSSVNERFKILKKDLKRCQVKPEKIFYLTNIGRKTIVKLSEIGEDSFSSSQHVENFSSLLYVEDIRNVLLTSFLGHSPVQLHWSQIEPARKKFKTVLIQIEGISQEDISKLYEPFPNKSHGSYLVKILSSKVHFATELSAVCFSDFYAYSGQIHSLFPLCRKRKRDEECVGETSNSNQQGITKLNLVLKPTELLMESYPLPQFMKSVSDSYFFSKDEYIPVTANSPMFALDCEMGLSAKGQKEILWIAIVNENLQVLYHSFVKPEENIVDYLTRFSGVTEDMLKDVKTTLNDVRNKINEILPKDAILCGQSLNNDLHALKLLHPYVIDTSLIFNPFGIRGHKLSLKALVKTYLKETIQEGSHNPVEDATATMKLVLFRLNNPLAIKRMSRKVKERSFFSRIAECSKKACLVGSDASLQNYCGDIPEKITLMKKSTMADIFEEVSMKVDTHNLILSHLVMDASTYNVQELKDGIKRVYDKMPNYTLFSIIFSDIHKNNDKNFNFNYGIFVLKKN